MLSFFSLQFQIYSITIRMHHFPSLFSIFLCSSISFQIPSECTMYHPCYQIFLCFKLFKCCQNAPFTVFVFKVFSAVPNTVRMHPLSSFFFKFSRRLPSPLSSLVLIEICIIFLIAVSNSVKSRALVTLFSKISLQFKIISKSIRMHTLPCFQMFQEASPYAPSCFSRNMNYSIRM